MKKYITIPRNITYEQYLFGDFNKNGVKNIDDPRPFDPNESKADVRRQLKAPNYQNKVRYFDKDTNMSTTLTNTYNDLNYRRPFMLSYLNNNPTSFGRVKSVASTLNKLRGRYINSLGDTVGVTSLTSNRSSANSLTKSIYSQYRVNRKTSDNFGMNKNDKIIKYKKPLGGVHYAYHLSILSPKGFSMEAQVKTAKMSQLDFKMHPTYKKGGSDSRFKPFIPLINKYVKKGLI